MASEKSGKLIYSPEQVAEWFDMSYSMIAQWELSGLVDKPDSGPNGEKVYKWHHIRQIASRVRELVRDELKLLVEENPEGLVPPVELLERLYKAEFFGGDDPEHGLQQLEGLAQYEGLSSDTINSLIKEAIARPRGDIVRPQVWRILLTDEELEA